MLAFIYKGANVPFGLLIEWQERLGFSSNNEAAVHNRPKKRLDSLPVSDSNQQLVL